MIFLFLFFPVVVVIAGFFIFCLGGVSRAAGNQLALSVCTNGQCSAGDFLQTTNNNGDYWIFNSPEALLSTGEINLSACTAASVSFDYKRYYSSATGTSDMLYLESSADGNEWQAVQSFQGLTTAFVSSTPVSLFCGTSRQFRFRGSVDADSRHGVGVNNIRFDLTAPVPVNQPPTAAAAADKTTAEAGEEIAFSDAGSSDPDGDSLIDWLWDFGQQLIKHGQNVSHSFADSGSYTVSYYVVDSIGATSSPAIINLTITDAASSTPATTTPTTTPAALPQSGDVVINEIYPAPNTGEDEWIELYNPASSTWDLSGLMLLNIDGGKFVTTTLSGTIAPGQYLVVENISGSLNNDGDTIVLRSADQFFEQTIYGDYSNKKGEAWARNASGVFAETITPTKGAVNIITPKPAANSGGGLTINYKTTTENKTTSTAATSTQETVNYYGKIIINELYPHPATDKNDEFVELKNISSSTIDLNGFYLMDNTKTKHYLRGDSSLLQVPPQGYLAIKRASSSLVLNNTGFETASLFSPTGDLLDRISYTAKDSEGLAYARTIDGQWLWTEEPTPGTENIFPSGLSEEQTAELISAVKSVAKKASGGSGVLHRISMEELKRFNIGDHVQVTGVVSVVPGVLGSQIFYLAGSGIQVYCNKKDFPALKLGDKVQVTGEISETGGERRIKIKTRDDIKYISAEAEPAPHDIAVVDLEDNIGSLVRISGDLLEIKGRNAFVDDGTGEAKVYLKTQIDTKELNWHTGDKVTIVGIASLTAAGARLLPRSSQDIAVAAGQVKGAFETGQGPAFWGSSLSYALAVIVFLAAVIGWLIYKLRIKN